MCFVSNIKVKGNLSEVIGIKNDSMKRNLLLQLLIIGIGAFIWMSHSAGRAADKNQGNTGAPGDATATCGSSGCHAGSSITVDLDIAVMDGNSNMVSNYVPGETYTVRVTVNQTGGNNPAAFGYQLVALTDSDNQSTESFSNPASNVQIANATSTGRTYAEHNGPSNTNTFDVEWTAPAAGSGSVTFYSAGNGVNGNGMSSGDGASTASMTLNEGTSSNFNPTALKWELKLFPNPVRESINISANELLNGEYTITVVDMMGRVVKSFNSPIVDGNLSFDANDLKTGHYSLMVQDKDETAVIQFSKL